MASCKDFLATLADATCLESFLADLPGPVRQSLAAAVTALNTISQAEAFLSSEGDRLLDQAVDRADEALAATLAPLDALASLFDELSVFLSPFTTCAAVNTILSTVMMPILQAQNAVRSATWRKNQMKQAAVIGASTVSRTIFQAAQAASPFGTTAQGAADIFDGIRDCIGAVGPPFLP